MSRVRLTCWAAAVVALVSLLVPADSAAGQDWRGLPWHLVSIDYDYAQPGPFQSIEVAAVIDGPVATGQNLFYCAFFGDIGGTAFYFGLQTDIKDPRHGIRTKGIIFSRWGSVDTGDADPPADGWAVAHTDAESGEGDFTSVRTALDWGPGRYLFRMERHPDEDGRGWWARLRVKDVFGEKWIDAGRLRFPATAQTIKADADSFIELYSDPPTPDFPNDYAPPPWSLFIEPPLVDGLGPATGAVAWVGANIPRLGEATWRGSAVQVKIRRPQPPGTPLPANDNRHLMPLFQAR